jgi:Zn-dependent peptidase ImmA (M78 family)
MTEAARPRPFKEAARITKMLDHALGVDRFDKAPVDVAELAVEYSRATAAQTPIHEVTGRRLEGCAGALVYSEERPRQWGILFDQKQSPGRRAFTVAHEFGHWVLHRALIEDDPSFDGGIYCDENAVVRRDVTGIEQEADEFAANLLMPLHDFRRQLPATEQPTFDRLSAAAKRYGVSLTAAILRWLEYTETRAMMIVSNEGFAVWARSSDSALKTRRYIRTRDTVFELPATAFAARRDYSDAARTGVLQPSGVWFPEQALEMCLRSERYDHEITLLHFDKNLPPFDFEAHEEDTFDRFVSRGQLPVR